MSGHVFISCGQATQAERQVANTIETWLKEKGLQPYVAITAQSVQDINSGIIGRLKRCDYYIFIDFRREKLGGKKEGYRGSLFTNQELSIAYLLGIDDAIFLQQKGIQPEGMLRYMASNPSEFESHLDVLPLVQKLVTERRWDAGFSRHLQVCDARWSQGYSRFTDHTGERKLMIYYVDVANACADRGASDAVVRLHSWGKHSTELRECVDQTLLKVTGAEAFSQTIWPKSRIGFDLFGVSESSKVFLNSARDVKPRMPIIVARGTYRLSFQVFAQGFEVVPFIVDLTLPTKGPPRAHLCLG